MATKIHRPVTTTTTIAHVEISDTPGHVELTLESSYMQLTVTEARTLAAALTEHANEADTKAGPA